MDINYDIHKLKEGEIAGQETINPIVTFVQGMRSISDFLTINPNGRGSINLDLDFTALAANILKLVKIPELNFDFECSISNNGRLTVSSGTVFLPFHSVSVPLYSYNLDSLDSGKMVYVRLSHDTNESGDVPNKGEIVLSSGVTHTLQTGNSNYRVTLPVATLTKNNSVWSVKYHHIGAFDLTTMPYFYVSGYNKGATQSLDHEADTDGGKWVSYGECDNA